MNQGPYHIIPIGILLILSYLGSLLAVRMQLLDPGRHKRSWNLLLLLFFLSASLLGIFLAVKVNYKLNISWIDPVMQWHVETGIALAFVATFHLTWHLGYYKKALTRWKAPAPDDKLKPFLDFNLLQIKILFALLGFITLVTQLVLLREYIKALHGNELVIGMFLALWMVLTAAGAKAGANYRARIKAPTILRAFVLIAVFPVFLYLVLILIARLVLLPGIVPGMLSSVTHMVLIVPFTLVTGFLFSYLARAVKFKNPGATFYMLDSLGSLAGGVLFGLLLVFFLGNLQVMILVYMLTMLTLAILFRYPGKPAYKIFLLFAGVTAFSLMLLPRIKNGIEGMRYQGETILEARDTPHGNVTFTDRDGLVTGYLDRNPVVSSSELAVCEEQVHYPALQHKAPVSFLLIGGGLSGTEDEILKYMPERFDYCEANRWMYHLGLKYLHAAEYHRFIKTDGRRWLAKNDTVKYDVIISSAGEPLTLGWNRYFTREFYDMARSSLTEEGIFSVRLPSSGNYINEAATDQLRITYLTLKEVFTHVALVPGQATWFLASENPLSLDYPVLLKDKGILTTYVHGDYLDTQRLTFESDILLERIREKEDRINSDLWPVLFFRSLTGWSNMIGGKGLLYIGILGLLAFILLMFTYPRLRSAMYVAGFSGAGMQILLIMVMQAYYGIVYLAAPLMITLFMAGIVVGTFVWKEVWRNPSISKTTGLMWILALTSAATVVLLKTEQLFVHHWSGMTILCILNIIPGLVVGSVYGMLVQLHHREAPSGQGRLYNADLAGAAIGSLLPPLFLVPLIGVSNTFILFCGINVAAGLYVQKGKR